jgi:hypothetical protein
MSRTARIPKMVTNVLFIVYPPNLCRFTGV